MLGSARLVVLLWESVVVLCRCDEPLSAPPFDRIDASGGGLWCRVIFVRENYFSCDYSGLPEAFLQDEIIISEAGKLVLTGVHSRSALKIHEISVVIFDRVRTMFKRFIIN